MKKETMETRTNRNVGSAESSQGETVAREDLRNRGIKVRTSLKAGYVRPPMGNHNETLVAEARKASGVKVRTNLKAGVYRRR